MFTKQLNDEEQNKRCSHQKNELTKCYVINEQNILRASLIIQNYRNQECKSYKNNSKLEKI